MKTAVTFGLTLRLVTLLLVAAGIARARVVNIRVGRNGEIEGQGWMFLDTDGRCKVLTPAHVVLNENGQMARGITVSDPKLGMVTASAPVILSPSADLDVAVLPLRGADDPTTCGTGRVTDLGVQRRILNMADARIERIDDLSAVTSAVHFRTRGSFNPEHPRSPVNDEGATFTVVSSLDSIRGGWSGSAIVDADGTLLGMVTDADTYDKNVNAGKAVAATALRYLLDHVKASAAAASGSNAVARWPIRVLAGRTPDAMYSQDGLYNAADQGWLVMPVNGKVMFTVLFGRWTHLHGFDLGIAQSTNTVQGIELATPDAESSNTWQNLSYCPMPNSQGDLRCTGIGTTAVLVRVTLTLRQDSPVQLYGLTVVP